MVHYISGNPDEVDVINFHNLPVEIQKRNPTHPLDAPFSIADVLEPLNEYELN